MEPASCKTNTSRRQEQEQEQQDQKGHQVEAEETGDGLEVGKRGGGWRRRNTWEKKREGAGKEEVVDIWATKRRSGAKQERRSTMERRESSRRERTQGLTRRNNEVLDVTRSNVEVDGVNLLRSSAPWGWMGQAKPQQGSCGCRQ